MLGVALDQPTKTRAVETILSFQNPVTGGFGGGPWETHKSHLLPTYASICCLAIAGDVGVWERIDREGVYRFFMSCKKGDGSFVVCEGGEVDVR